MTINKWRSRGHMKESNVRILRKIRELYHHDRNAVHGHQQLHFGSLTASTLFKPRGKLNRRLSRLLEITNDFCISISVRVAPWQDTAECNLSD